jgi:hypothetical protein
MWKIIVIKGSSDFQQFTPFRVGVKQTVENRISGFSFNHELADKPTIKPASF